MATFSIYPEHGNRMLCTISHTAKAGDVVELSCGSRAYTLGRGAFGWRSCQFTRYTLPEPVGVNAWGEPLFDLTDLGVCPLDGSPQTYDAELAAWEADCAARSLPASMARQLCEHREPIAA